MELGNWGNIMRVLIFVHGKLLAYPFLGAETRIFWENWVRAIAVDDPALVKFSPST